MDGTLPNQDVHPGVTGILRISLNMSKKIITRIRNIKDYQKNYVTQVKNAVETVPVIEKNIEWTEWAEKSVIESENKNNSIFNTPEFENSLSLIEDSIKNVLPNLSIDPLTVGGTIGAANATLSEVVFDRINRGAFGSSNSATWVNSLNSDYYCLQKKQNIVDDITNMLKSIRLKNEFLKAIDKYLKVNSEISSCEEVAIIMRNVMEGLQGSLFELVRKNSKVIQSKKNMQWEYISNSLSIGGQGSSQSLLLLEKKLVFDDIHNKLSDIAKNSVPDPKSLLQTYYSKWLDFFYTTLNLINPKYLK